MRGKEGVPQGIALFPACERGCPWLAACQLSLHPWASGTSQKCPNVLLKRTQSTCSGGWTALGVLASMVWALQRSLQPSLQHLLHPGKRIWPSEYPNWTFLWVFKGQDPSREFCRWLGKASWYFKIEASFLSLAKVPGNRYFFLTPQLQHLFPVTSPEQWHLLPNCFTLSHSKTQKLFAGFETKTAFRSEDAFLAFQNRCMLSASWVDEIKVH